MSWPAAAMTAVGALGFAELLLRLDNPYRLWSRGFDEGAVVEPHATRGWMTLRNHHFTFHHRYLRQPVEIRTNQLGQHDICTYSINKDADVFRVALFGDTTAAGYELPPAETIAAQLASVLRSRAPTRRIEVMNACIRLYGTGQLYRYYREEIAEYRPNLVIYHFNLNHPRRTITAHESGKSITLSQPVFRVGDDGKLDCVATPAPDHPNDLIYLNETGCIQIERGRTDRSIYHKLRDRSHLLTILEDIRLGAVALRPFRDRVEIKDIELKQYRHGYPVSDRDMPYQWQVVSAILARWSRDVQAQGGQFLVTSHPAYYCIRQGAMLHNTKKHPWGFPFAEIPERRYLPFIARKNGFFYFDTFAYLREHDMAHNADDYVVHPRYAYPNRKGAGVIAEALAAACQRSRAGMEMEMERRR